MIFALTIFFFSIAGITALLLRHVPHVANMSEEEIAGVLQRERPLVTHIWESGLWWVRTIWFRHFREQTFVFIVKRISWLRIITLRMEQALFRFGARMRTRTHITKEPSLYWKDMHTWRKTVHWSKKGEK